LVVFLPQILEKGQDQGWLILVKVRLGISVKGVDRDQSPPTFSKIPLKGLILPDPGYFLLLELHGGDFILTHRIPCPYFLILLVETSQTFPGLYACIFLESLWDWEVAIKRVLALPCLAPPGTQNPLPLAPLFGFPFPP